jgi:hypothetical protein
LPASHDEWAQQREEWLAALKEKCFAGWPAQPGTLELKQVLSAERRGVDLDAYEFTSQPNIRLRLYLTHRPHLKKPERVQLVVQNEVDWQKWIAGMSHGFELQAEHSEQQPAGREQFEKIRQVLATNNWVFVYIAPRGVGPTAWSGDAKKEIQIRRRFMLLGQTLDGMRVWDIRRALQAVQSFRNLQGVPVVVEAKHDLAVDALYASLFETGIAALDLSHVPLSHRDGPDYLNVLRVLDIPQAMAMAEERSQVRLFETEPNGWEYPAAVAQGLGWNKKQFVVEPLLTTTSK